jgi:ABC-type Fe3+-hydroxamate transport system substrate-binding protein
LAVVLAGCARAGAPAASGPSGPTASTTGATFPVTVTDDDGATVTIDAPPSRIVTFAPSPTEIVYDWGMIPLYGARLVITDPADPAVSARAVGGAALGIACAALAAWLNERNF